MYFNQPRQALPKDIALGEIVSKTAAIIIANYKEAAERANAQEALRQSEEKYRTLFDSIDEGFCIINVIFDDNKNPVDYRFIEMNPAFTKQTGWPDARGKTMRELSSLREHFWFEVYGRIAQTGEPERFEHDIAGADTWFSVFAFRIGPPEENRVAVIFNDITRRKRIDAHVAFLAEIANDFSNLSTAEEIMQVAGARIGAYLNVTACNFTDVYEEADEVIVHHGWSHPSVPSTVGVFKLSRYLNEEFKRANRNNETVIVCDTQTDSRTDAEGYAALNMYSFVTVPFHVAGKWTHYIAICDSRPREWRNDEVEVIREICRRIFPRLERARAEDALRESEERLRITVESALDFGIINADTEGIIEGWNSGAEKIFAIPATEAVGRPIRIIFSEDDIKKGIPEKEMETARTEGSAADDRWHKRGDGSKIYVSGAMWPIFNPDLQGYVKVMRDLTDKKKEEQQKDDFITIASHELKTPVTSIKAYTEVIHEMMADSGLPEGAALMKKLDGQVDRLIGLIRTLLDTSRVSQGNVTLNCQDFELDELINERIQEMQQISSIHQIYMTGDSDIHVHGDRERIGQVVTNLISNAIKYSPDGGQIIIHCKTAENEVLVGVEDQGIGISDEGQRKLFSRFSRADDVKSSHYPGLGLGLYISSNIVKSHGGRIWVESRQDEGSTFYFTLPC